MSPIEQVRCTKVPYRIYIYDRFPATFCVAPALQNPPIACLRGARSVSDGGMVRASAPCRRLHESLADFHRDLYRFQAVRRLFIGKPVENRLITRIAIVANLFSFIVSLICEWRLDLFFIHHVASLIEIISDFFNSIHMQTYNV